MAEALERDVVIELLNKLGSDRDEEVLAAARQAAAKIAAAGLTWEDLLVPERSDDDEDYDDDEDDIEHDDDEDDLEDEDEEEDDVEDDDDDEEDDEEAESEAEAEAEETSAEQAERNAPSLKLIEQLLAKADTSASLREELKGYKDDIKEGEFQESDRRYLRALHGRLSKGR